MKKIYLIMLIVFIILIITGGVYYTRAFSVPNYSVSESFNVAKELVSSEKVMLIVDFSDSMNECLGSKRKIDIAMENLSILLPAISPSVKLGLRVYGHKNSFSIYHACTASEMIVPPTKNSAPIISDALRTLVPKGVTPITYSLKKCIENDFQDYKGKKHIILISDGKENCDESPCKFAIELMKNRDDIFIDVIALGIDDPEAVAQLKCAALTTGGKFFKSNTSYQFYKHLKNSLEIHKEVQGEILLK